MVFVVAEIGVNWNGDFELLEQMMLKSKESGCNSIKLQAFNEKIVENHPEKFRLMKTTVDSSNIEKIDSIAKKIGIEWFCTPMYKEAIEFLNPFVSRFKIRNSDSLDYLKNGKSELVEAVIKTKKIVYASVSDSKIIPDTNTNGIKWLYVVPKYPTNLEDLDFSQMGKFDGYSNHCPKLVAPLTAAILGANTIEIHITSDKTKDFFDNNVSLDYQELTSLLNLIREIEQVKI
jgi:sialic acid synthase SpsE